MNFYQGERVKTPNGIGTVVYQRMKAPDYSSAEAVSVKLDNVIRYDYVGTIFKAEDIQSIDNEDNPIYLGPPLCVNLVGPTKE